MTRKRIEDLVNVEVEHLLGLVTGDALVKLRVESDGTVIVGQMSTVQAREIAGHLVESAARAEYELDYFTEATRIGLDDRAIALMLHMIREGEARRHQLPKEQA